MTCLDKPHPSSFSTTVDIISMSLPPISSIPSANTEKPMANVSHRIKLRKDLHTRLCLVSNVMCFLGLFGIILMIIDNELTFAFGDKKDTTINWFIKLTISISTIILIALIIYYHKLDLNLYSIRNTVEDWRIGLTGKKIFFITIEILICSIHPIPRQFYSNDSLNPSSTTTTDALPISYTSLDVALSLPMFARLYLLCRFLIYHSHLLHNASFRSLGYLNQVSIDFSFLIKTYLEQWPTRCLILWCITIFFIGSWSLRACNYSPTTEHVSIADSMWLFIVTSTTVGYGDITPSTYCGRGVAAIIVFTGILSTALLISVLAQKLVLTRWEKYVYNFVLNIELAKERKNQAANVMKFAIQMWYLRRKEKSKSIQCRKVQWKLFRSIRVIQQVKVDQRKLIDSSVVLADLFTLQRNGNDQMEKMIQRMQTMEMTIDKIEEKFSEINQTVNRIEEKLNGLLDRI